MFSSSHSAGLTHVLCYSKLVLYCVDVFYWRAVGTQREVIAL